MLPRGTSGAYGGKGRTVLPVVLAAGKKKPVVTKPKVAPAPAGRKPALTMQQFANQLVTAELAPYYAQVKEQERVQAEAEARRSAAIQGFSQSMIQTLQGQPGQVQQDYEQTIGQLTGLANSAQQSLQAANPTSSEQGVLSAVNAPAGQQQQLAAQNQAVFGGGGAVLGYLGGTLPAETLTREELSQLAYTRGLPSIAALAGQGNLRDALYNSSLEQAKISAQRGDIAAKEPGLFNQVFSQLQNRQIAQQNAAAKALYDQQVLKWKMGVADQNTATARAALGLKAQSQNFSQKLAVEKLKLASKAQNLGQARLALQQVRDDHNYQLGLQRLGISDRSLQLRILEAAWKQKHPTKKGGFTANQRTKLSGQALKMAGVFANGGTLDEYRATDAQPGEKGYGQKAYVKVAYDPLSYSDALLNMLEAGIPAQIAVRSLKRYYGTKEAKTVQSVGKILQNLGL